MYVPTWTVLGTGNLSRQVKLDNSEGANLVKHNKTKKRPTLLMFIYKLLASTILIEMCKHC